MEAVSLKNKLIFTDFHAFDYMEFSSVINLTMGGIGLLYINVCF